MTILNQSSISSVSLVFLFPRPAESIESKEIAKAFETENWWTFRTQNSESIWPKHSETRKYISKAYVDASPEIEYRRPKPKRAYSVKVRVSHRAKKRPVDYDS